MYAIRSYYGENEQGFAQCVVKALDGVLPDDRPRDAGHPFEGGVDRRPGLLVHGKIRPRNRVSLAHQAIQGRKLHEGGRITSYNVCYTKLLRVNSLSDGCQEDQDCDR